MRSFAAAIKAWSSTCAYLIVVFKLLCPISFPTVAKLTPFVVNRVAVVWRSTWQVIFGLIERAALASDRP
jgi:hypothetical protein